jgi:hypothetical protein
MSIAEHLYDLATRLWYRLVDSAAGPPGPVGPDSDELWNENRGYLLGAIATLEDILKHMESK